MRAFVKQRAEPGADLVNVPDPVPKEGEVLIAVRASSICGTDVHIWEWNEWARSRVRRLPLTVGHEVSGEVIRLGPGVTSLAVGDHVSAETHIADGTCYQCRTGRMHICENVQVLGVDRDGVFAEFAVLPELNAWKNDPHLDHALASIQEPLGNAVHCFFPEGDEESISGKTVLITGCGPIGLLGILLAKTLGAGTVVATEVNPLRATLAKRMGADLVLDPTVEKETVAARVRDATGGSGVDLSMEMSGHPASLRLVFDALRPGGRVSLLGLLDGEASLDFDNAIIFRGARVHGISGRRMFDSWYTVKGLLASPSFREKMASIITHRVPIGDLPRAMEILHSAQAAKVSLEA
ncbi:MAG TPA: L-threonine 3-dehydrogenase, partial [Thermoplasmata archaeon]|nr:L-threonine 3-dehydrogenase [Thermoplasmata archaeon]